MTKIRQPAVAGQFYPGEAKRLREAITHYLVTAKANGAPTPKAIIAPHAGYIYSGPIAGNAYARLAQGQDNIRRIILIGPAHWAPVRGLAASSADAFATPLGTVPLDQEARLEILSFPQVNIYDGAHEREHGLEVHLPFLQIIFSDFTLVPLVVGEATPNEVAEVLDCLWGDDGTVIVVSSDLSHYHDYETATRLDQATSRSIESFRPLKEGQACGRKAINGLLLLAQRRNLKVETIDLRNSGDTAGSRDRVVGYGAFIFTN